MALFYGGAVGERLVEDVQIAVTRLRQAISIGLYIVFGAIAFNINVFSKLLAYAYMGSDSLYRYSE